MCGVSAVHVPVNQHLLTNQEFRIKQHCGINIVTDVIKIMNHQSNARNASIDIIKSSPYGFFFSLSLYLLMTTSLKPLACSCVLEMLTATVLGFLDSSSPSHNHAFCTYTKQEEHPRWRWGKHQQNQISKLDYWRENYWKWIVFMFSRHFRAMFI